MLLGALLLVPGLLLLADLGCSWGHSMVADPDGRISLADLVVPSILVLLGLGPALLRWSTYVDPTRRAVIKRWGWGPWQRERVTPLGDLTHIAIQPAEQRGTDSGRYITIPVAAVQQQGSVELGACTDLSAARHLARRLASGFGLPINGRFAGQERLVAVADLDRPLTALVRPDATALRQPAASRLVISELPRGVAVRLPLDRSDLLGGMLVGLGILLIGGLFWRFVWQPELVPRARESWLAWCFMMAPLTLILSALLGAVVIAMRNGSFGGVLTIERDGLRTDLRSGLYRVRAADLRGLEITPDTGAQRALVVITSRREFPIARGQGRGDLEWLQALILHHLSAP